MRRVLLITLSLVLTLTSWSTAGAEDGFYVIPAVRGNYSPVPKTGQTTSYDAGDDGALQRGVASPTPRFKDNNNGTVTDNLTGLIWMKNANAFGLRNWTQSINDANTLAAGYGGLTDGSQPGDWRLPNIRELQSLQDYEQYPSLPPGHPFVGVQDLGSLPKNYWSSTTRYAYSTDAYVVGFSGGNVGTTDKQFNYGVWCVRGGY
jgi:hypothetical protein